MIILHLFHTVNAFYDSESGHHLFIHGRPLTSVFLFKVNKLSTLPPSLTFTNIHQHPHCLDGISVGIVSSIHFVPSQGGVNDGSH